MNSFRFPGSGILLANLTVQVTHLDQRIGELVDALRQIAVDGGVGEFRQVGVDVANLSAVEVKVTCAPDLVMTDYDVRTGYSPAAQELWAKLCVTTHEWCDSNETIAVCLSLQIDRYRHNNSFNTFIMPKIA
ncbi:MAG: hypothetical protein V1738_02365 [Patescibacteria group bacterium]